MQWFFQAKDKILVSPEGVADKTCASFAPSDYVGYTFDVRKGYTAEGYRNLAIDTSVKEGAQLKHLHVEPIYTTSMKMRAFNSVKVNWYFQGHLFGLHGWNLLLFSLKHSFCQASTPLWNSDVVWPVSQFSRKTAKQLHFEVCYWQFFSSLQITFFLFFSFQIFSIKYNTILSGTISRAGMGDGIWVPGLGLGLGLIFVGLPGLGLIFVGQSRQGPGTGTENTGTWASKIPWDWLSPTGLQLIPRTNVKWQILSYPYPQKLKPYKL